MDKINGLIIFPSREKKNPFKSSVNVVPYRSLIHVTGLFKEIHDRGRFLNELISSKRRALYNDTEKYSKFYAKNFKYFEFFLYKLYDIVYDIV